MKNKVVTIFCVVLIVLAVVCVGYIFIFSNQGNDTPTQDEQQETEQQPQQPEGESPKEEKGQNIIVTSRIGVQLREIIRTSNIYSNLIVEELDSNGLTDETKILFSLDKIFRKEEYSDYAQYSEEYSNTYITAENMHNVINATFIDKDINDVSVGDILPYDELTNCYIVPSVGYPGGTFNYTVEVPYKITEYTDRVELLAYRLYITKTVVMEDLETTVTNEIFYDKQKSLLALTITDTSLDLESNQANYLKTKIDDKTIESTSLESVQYTFKVEDDSYKISEFKKI